MLLGCWDENERKRRMHYCYILYSLKTNIFYIDLAADIDLALVSHNDGRMIATKPHLPWEIIWREAFDSEAEARNFAQYLKSRHGSEFAYKRLVASLFPEIQNRRKSVSRA